MSDGRVPVLECPKCKHTTTPGKMLDAAIAGGGDYLCPSCGRKTSAKKVRAFLTDKVMAKFNLEKDTTPRRRNLSGGMIAWLRVLNEIGGTARPEDIARVVMERGSRTAAGGGDPAKTRWWGLSQKKDKHWTLTDKGRRYLLGEIKVPKYCFGPKGPFEGPDVSVTDVVGAEAEVSGVDTQYHRK